MTNKKRADPKTPEIKRGRGAPTIYTPELAASICACIVEGDSLRAIHRKPGMPGINTIWRWLDEKPGFREQYAHAREEQAEKFAQEIVSIADEACGDSTAAQRNRLRVDARKWVASKLKPKTYGEKLDLTADVGVTYKTADDVRGAWNGILARLGVAQTIGVRAKGSARTD